MTPAVVADHGLLVVAVVALAAAGLRIAAALGADGLERALAGFTLASAGAVLASLGLGSFGAGGDGVALTAAALGTWGGVRRLTPAPRAGDPLAALRRVAARVALGAGALAGVVLGWIAFQLRHPFIGGDGLIYHLPIASAWVQNGRPGSVVSVLDGLPVGNYPVTNEVLVSFGLAISRSWVIASVWSPVLFVALAAGGWLALGELAVPARERVLGVAAIGVLPLSVFGLGGPTTDIAATAWLAVTAGLASASRRVPGLVYPAVLAAALCLGTKTTPAVLVLGLAILGARPLRTAAREHPGWLAAVLGLGLAVGGVWPLRNLIDHGSPLWPLVAAPWGDPVPAGLRPFEVSFLAHPRQVVGTYYQGYLDVVAGGLVLMAGAVILPVARRSGAALAAGVAAGLAVLAWSLAPYTGILTDGFAVGATRYLLPALAACALAVALSARGAGRWLRRIVTLTLAAATVWSVWRTGALGYPYVPSLRLLALAGAVGALGAWVVRRGRPRVDRRILAGAGAIAGAVGLAVAGDGYAARHAGTGLPDATLVRAGLPGLVNGTRPIASAPGTVVMLRGDRLEHALTVIPGNETCAGVRGRLRRGPVVLEADPPSAIYTRLRRCLAGVAPRRLSGYYDVYY